MSTDYFIICPDKLVWMPIYTMGLGGNWQVDKRYMFDFLLECSGCEIKIIQEQTAEWDECHEDENGWRFVNSWHEYQEG